MEKVKKNNSPNQTDNVWWRPSKLDNFLIAMEKVLNKWMQSIILTDEELFILANEELEEKDKISYTTFKDYKAKWNKEQIEWFKKFSSLYKKAIIEQKNNLFEKLDSDNPQWQKYAWIIERKFSEWNLRQISEVDNKISWELKTTSAVEELNNLLHK